MNIFKKIAIKKLVKSINPDIKIKFQKQEMECDIDEEIVWIGATDKLTDKLFMNYIKELNPNCNASCLLLSILHEVGHIETYDEEEMEQRDFYYGILQLNAKNTDMPIEELCDAYFRLPAETEATQWAIDFITNNPGIIEKYKILK